MTSRVNAKPGDEGLLTPNVYSVNTRLARATMRQYLPAKQPPGLCRSEERRRAGFESRLVRFGNRASVVGVVDMFGRCSERRLLGGGRAPRRVRCVPSPPTRAGDASPR